MRSAQADLNNHLCSLQPHCTTIILHAQVWHVGLEPTTYLQRSVDSPLWCQLLYSVRFTKQSSCHRGQVWIWTTIFYIYHRDNWFRTSNRTVKSLDIDALPTVCYPPIETTWLCFTWWGKPMEEEWLSSCFICNGRSRTYIISHQGLARPFELRCKLLWMESNHRTRDLQPYALTTRRHSKVRR